MRVYMRLCKDFKDQNQQGPANERKELGDKLLACLLACSHQGAAGT